MDLLRGQSAGPPDRPSAQQPWQATASRRQSAVHTAGSESQGGYRQTGGDECGAKTESFLKQAKAQVRPQ